MENINTISESNLEKFCNLKNFIPDTEYINKKVRKYEQDSALPEKSHKAGTDKSCKNVIYVLIRNNKISDKRSEKYGGITGKDYLHRMVAA